MAMPAFNEVRDGHAGLSKPVGGATHRVEAHQRQVGVDVDVEDPLRLAFWTRRHPRLSVSSRPSEQRHRSLFLRLELTEVVIPVPPGFLLFHKPLAGTTTTRLLALNVERIWVSKLFVTHELKFRNRVTPRRKPPANVAMADQERCLCAVLEQRCAGRRTGSNGAADGIGGRNRHGLYPPSGACPSASSKND